MQTYRISKPKYAGALTASGLANRWNRDNQYVIYTASSRALACLELAVHLDQTSVLGDFSITVLDIPDKLAYTDIQLRNLPIKWWHRSAYFDCQKLADDWINSQESCILKVPSSIIHQEYNYVLNTLHPDFKKIQIAKVEAFNFDARLLKS